MTPCSLRILSDNLADTASISAPSTASNLGAEWVQTDVKSEVCRVLSSTATFTLAWDDTQGFDVVAVPAWNGGASSEIRAQIYDATVGGSLVWDSGWQWAAPGPQLGVWDFSQPLNVNDFTQGATVSTVWVPNISGKRLVLSLRDLNLAYIDVSRIVAGLAARLRGASYDSGVSAVDDTRVVRAASGDMKVDRGPKRRVMALDLNYVPLHAQHQVTRIINAGLGRRHFVSALPDGDNVTMTQALEMYGVLSVAPRMAYSGPNAAVTQFQIEEW